MEMIRERLDALVKLTDAECEAFRNELIEKEVPANTILLKENELCDQIYFIKEGIFRVYIIDKDDNEKTAFFHFENEFLTELESFLMHKPSRYYIQSLTNASIYCVSREVRDRLHNKIPVLNDIAAFVFNHNSLHLRKRLEDFVFLTPEERYLKLLETNPDIFNKISLALIADYINIRPQSLSRIRKRLLNSSM